MYLYLIPFIIQLFCIIHVIKTHRPFWWIYLLIFLPYVGGIAYLIIELLPDLFSPHRRETMKTSVIKIVKPNQSFEILEQKAKFTSTFANMIEYADALTARERYEEALEIYNGQNKGPFLDDVDLLYKIAACLYASGKPEEALETLNRIYTKNESLRKQVRENLLYLAVIGQCRDKDFVIAEYQRVLDSTPNNEIQIEFIRFLMEKKEDAVLNEIFDRAHYDEKALKINNVYFNKDYYKQINRLEREYKSKN